MPVQIISGYDVAIEEDAAFIVIVDVESLVFYKDKVGQVIASIKSREVAVHARLFKGAVFMTEVLRS